MKKVLISGFIILATFALTISVNAWPQWLASPNRASFGEPCNKKIRCDARGWLGCYNGTCGCIKQEEMIYEEDLRKCVSKSGERCAFALTDAGDNSFLTEIWGCVSNAKCSPDGICECGNKFYENSNGTCSPALDHLEVCESGAQCSGYQALDCKDGVCQCDESKSTYSHDIKDPQCVGLAGSPCINSKCIDEATCSENMCVCNENFYMEDSGLCFPQVERAEFCSEDKQCLQLPGQKLVCLDNKCECDPQVSIFATVRAFKNSDGDDSESEDQDDNFEGEFKTQCVGLAGFPCIDELCGPNAFCSFTSTNEDQQGTCKCMEGYTESKSHSCGTGYKTSCSSSSTCIDGLVCRNAKCLCPSRTQTFDHSKKMCINQVGGPCKSSLSCGKNAECKTEKASGHCVCRSGYVESMNGLCQSGYGMNCSSLEDCDSNAELQCIDGKCMCDGFSDFNSDLKKCVGLVGARCIYYSWLDKDECIENARCDRANSFAAVRRCMCEDGFEETSDYKCKPKYRGIFADI